MIKQNEVYVSTRFLWSAMHCAAMFECMHMFSDRANTLSLRHCAELFSYNISDEYACTLRRQQYKISYLPSRWSRLIFSPALKENQHFCTMKSKWQSGLTRILNGKKKEQTVIACNMHSMLAIIIITCYMGKWATLALICSKYYAVIPHMQAHTWGKSATNNYPRG